MDTQTMMHTVRTGTARPRLETLERVVRRELQATGTPSPLARWIRQLSERSGVARESVARVVAQELLGETTGDWTDDGGRSGDERS